VYRGVPKRTCGSILGESSRESEGAALDGREIKNEPVRWISDLRVGRFSIKLVSEQDFTYIFKMKRGKRRQGC